MCICVIGDLEIMKPFILPILQVSLNITNPIGHQTAISTAWAEQRPAAAVLGARHLQLRRRDKNSAQMTSTGKKARIWSLGLWDCERAEEPSYL